LRTNRLLYPPPGTVVKGRRDGLRRPLLASIAAALLLAGCGGGTDADPRGTAAQSRSATLGAAVNDGVEAGNAMTQYDAVRFLNQASFGPTEALVTQLRSKGAAQWISEQFAMGSSSSYTSGGDDSIHVGMTGVSF